VKVLLLSRFGQLAAATRVRFPQYLRYLSDHGSEGNRPHVAHKDLCGRGVLKQKNHHRSRDGQNGRHDIAAAVGRQTHDTNR